MNKAVRLSATALLLAFVGAGMANGQDTSHSDNMYKAKKQQANEEAEALCKRFQGTDKFDECLDLYFLDAAKFKAFLDANPPAADAKNADKPK